MKTVDPRGVERLDVYRNATLAGVLRRTEKGAVFEYDDAFFAAHQALPGGLATHLPYAQRTIETRGVNLHTYFAGLLPEGLRLKALVARAKTSEDDQFTLLVAAGTDCVGDLFPALPGTQPSLEGRPDESTALDRLSFAELFRRSLDAEVEPVVAGVQDKLSPSVISFPFATSGRRWILKLNPADKPRLVENEHFVMTMARQCGLDVAKTRLVHDRDHQPGLLVERFDRTREGRQWRGVHQEDGCQLLDRYPADKYRLSVADLALGLGRCASPAAECARLLEVVAFSYLVGNGDLHAKNLSVSGAGGALQLSPAYDLLTTRPYRDLKLALKFEGRDDHLKRAHFLDFGKRFGVAPRAVEARLDRLTSRAAAWLPRLKGLGFDARLTRQLEALMHKRLADLAA